MLVSLLAARYAALKELKKDDEEDEGALLSKLVAYCSKEAHSCVEKAAMIALVKLRSLEPDHNFSLRGETLAHAIAEDKSNGLVPFFVSATLGTTSCCSFDALNEIGPVCKNEGLHIVWRDVNIHKTLAFYLCRCVAAR